MYRTYEENVFLKIQENKTVIIYNETIILPEAHMIGEVFIFVRPIASVLLILLIFNFTYLLVFPTKNEARHLHRHKFFYFID